MAGRREEARRTLEDAVKGMKDGIAGSDVELVKVIYGDTGKATQMKLLEDALQTYPDLTIIGGVAPVGLGSSDPPITIVSPAIPASTILRIRFLLLIGAIGCGIGPLAVLAGEHQAVGIGGSVALNRPQNGDCAVAERAFLLLPPLHVFFRRDPQATF